MPAQQLPDYIKQALQQGVSREDIRNALLSAGWQPQDVEEALATTKAQGRVEAQKEIPVPVISEFPGPTALLREAQTIFTQRLGTFIGIMLVPILVGGLVAIPLVVVIQDIFLGTGILTRLSPSLSELLFGNLLLAFLLMVSFAFVGFVIQLWNQTALLYAIKDSEERIGVREAYRRGRHKIRSYLWVNILIGFVSFGGFLFFVVPGIIFSIWFILAPFIVIAEDLGGMTALLKSREYVKGRWLGVLGRFLFFGLFVFVTLIPIIILEVLGVPLIPDLGEIGASLLLTPLMMTYAFVIYKYLRALRGEFAFTPLRRSKIAFSLIGLLGPLFIIGAIVFALQFGQKLGLGSPVEMAAKARDFQRGSDQIDLKFALELYYVDEMYYPPTLDELTSEYFIEIPTDPETGLPYEYHNLQDGKDYQLCIDFETKPRECIDSRWREKGD